MHRLALREGWTTFWLVAFVVFTATWSVQLADWADGLHILSTVTLLGLLVGLILSRWQRIPPIVAHVVALLIGTVVVLYQMTGFLSDALGGRQEKLDYLWHRWQLWYGAVSQGERADDLYLFILLMASLLWVLSYISVWFVFRSHWVWLTLLLPGVILLLNMGYSQRVPSSLLVLYCFASILLLMRFTFFRRELAWKRHSVPYPDTLPWRGLWVASYLAFIIILAGWVIPFSTQSERIVAGWERINGPWRQFETTVNGWFASLRGPGGPGIGGFASFGDRFQLGGALRLTDDPVVLVKGDAAPYLVAHRYSIFTGRGWESRPDDETMPGLVGSLHSALVEFDAEQPFPAPDDSAEGRTEKEYSFEVYQPRGSIVYSVGDPGSVTIPTQAQIGWHYYRDEVIFVQTATEEDTPPELWPLVRLLKEADYTPPPLTPTPEADTESTDTPQVVEPTPPLAGIGRTGIRLGRPKEEAEIRFYLHQLREQQIQVSFMPRLDDYKVHELEFSGILPVYEDVEAIYARDGLRTGETYDIVARVSNATPDQLRAAGTDYPIQIRDRYLQLPEFSDRTQALAEQLAEGKDNPYDIASAIELYLRQNLRYNENVPNPPSNVDLVDYFLFEMKQGYCTYYASAMAEMLRILDIPARVAVGFYPANYDRDAGGYLYRDKNAHAWVEVYFPQYGWVPFEPTAARSAIQREAPTINPAASLDSGIINDSLLPLDREAEILAERNMLPDGFGSGGFVDQEDSTSSWVLRGVLAAVVLGIAIFSFFWVRGTRGMAPATRFFTKFQRGAEWSGLPIRPTMTPYEYAATVSRKVPSARPHVRLLADLYVRERFSREDLTESELNRAQTAWVRLRGMLVRYALLQRWRSSQRRDEDTWE